MKTQGLFGFTGLLVVVTLLTTAFYTTRKTTIWQEISNPSRQENNYTTLVFKGSESLPSSSWTKSVLFNSAGTKLYTFNLEEMSIYEFDVATRKISRKLHFKPTEAPGWDYELNKPMPSFEEKPVEACFSHDDKLLWVSLHNAGGIVSIRMDSLAPINKAVPYYPTKTLFIFNADKQRTDTVSVPFIKTGKTPKVISRTANNKYLLVSNWHSNSLSVIRINDSLPPYGKKVRDIRTGDFPRGIAVTDRYQKSFVTSMGSNFISVINSKSWKVEKNISTAYNPRHIVTDGVGRLFVSFNNSSQIACISAFTGRTLFKAATSAKPRTIVLSKNQRFLFVACYQGNTIDVFRINKSNFSRIYSINCNGNPVGIDLREDAGKLEVWLCTYNGNSLRVLSFDKK